MHCALRRTTKYFHLPLQYEVSPQFDSRSLQIRKFLVGKYLVNILFSTLCLVLSIVFLSYFKTAPGMKKELGAFDSFSSFKLK